MHSPPVRGRPDEGFKGRVRQSAIGFRKFVNLESIYENVCISLISEPFSIILDALESSVSPLSNFRIFRCSNAIVADDYGIIADGADIKVPTGISSNLVRL